MLPAGAPLGLYGFGASAHILIQIARHRGSDVYVCTREERHQALALKLGAVWAGGADAMPPVPLRSSILFAPAGPLVLPALAALDKGGTLSLAGIYMTPIPEMDYGQYLFQEHTLRSVTANTCRDGQELLTLVVAPPLHTQTTEFSFLLKQKPIWSMAALHRLRAPSPLSGMGAFPAKTFSFLSTPRSWAVTLSSAVTEVLPIPCWKRLYQLGQCSAAALCLAQASHRTSGGTPG